MSLLDRLFKRQSTSDRQRAAGPATGTAECPHLALAPRWDSAADMGHEDRATSYVCDSCHQAFKPAEVAHIRSEAANRLRLG